MAAMLDPVRHLADLAGFFREKESRERDDADAARELSAPALALPPGLELEWLGVAGYRLTYEGQTLLIDPYFSRVPFSSVLRRRRALPDQRLIERYTGGWEGVAGILVGHTHFDHAVDAPALARRFGCRAYGSESLAALMRLHGLGDSAVVAEPRRPYELGPFVVTFVPSVHSKLLLGLAVPYSGELTCEALDSLSPAAYRCGQVWGIRIEVAGISLYHQGSANLIEDEVPRGGVDVFLAGVAGRSFTEHYWERILTRLDPRVVVPSHYDDFFRPLDEPMGFSTNVNLAAVPDEVAAVSRDISTIALPPPSGAPLPRRG